MLDKIYEGDQIWVRHELNEIAASHAAHRVREEKSQGLKSIDDSTLIIMSIGDGADGLGFSLKRIWSTSHVRRALFVGCSLQIFQQLAAINTIMYYTSALLRAAGVRSPQTTIWLSVVTSGVSFLANFIPFALVERYGRR